MNAFDDGFLSLLDLLPTRAREQLEHEREQSVAETSGEAEA